MTENTIRYLVKFEIRNGTFIGFWFVSITDVKQFSLSMP